MASRMYESPSTLTESRRRNRLGLLGIFIVLLAAGAVLYASSGWPHLPNQLPSRSDLVSTLTGSDVQIGTLAYLFTTAGWLLWAWITGSILLHAVVVIGERIGSGVWVRPLRAFSERVTLPVARRLVEGALVATFVVHLASQVPLAAASGLPVTAEIQQAPSRSRAGDQFAQVSMGTEIDAQQRSVTYTVQHGDTLWSISERFYSTGTEFPRLVQANAGHHMPGGGVFERAAVIYPGWELTVPLPSTAVEQVNDHSYYVVESGDSLSGIAARLLGDENRWPAIFDLNHGTARTPDGRVLQDAQLIWPGLRLELPLSPAPTVPAPPSPVAVQPAAPPALAIPPPEPVVSASPVPTASPEIVVEPESLARPASQTAHGPAIPMPLELAAGAAAAAVIGGVALGRRRFRRSLDEPPTSAEPETDVVIKDGFAQADLVRSFARRVDGRETEGAVLVAEQALHFLSGHGIAPVSVISVSHGRRSTTMLLSAGLLEQERIASLAPELGAQLGRAGEARFTPDQDVALRISGLKTMSLLPPLFAADSNRPELIPLGVLPDRQMLFANWREMRHVLVTALPGAGGDVVLTSLVAALAAQFRPDELKLTFVMGRDALPQELLRLPHGDGIVVPTSDSQGVQRVLEDAREELLRRIHAAESDALPDGERPTWNQVVLVIAELADVPDDGTTLELLGSQGPAFGIRLLALTERAGHLTDDVLTHFTSRCVLQTIDEEESARLAGQADGADLGSGGDMLVRLDCRLPVKARGFRVAPEHLDELTEAMERAYFAPPRPVSPQTPSPEPEVEEPADDVTSAGLPIEDARESALPFEFTEPDEEEPADQVTSAGLRIEEPVALPPSDEPPDSEGTVPAPMEIVLEEVRSRFEELTDPDADESETPEPASRPSVLPAARIHVHCFGSLSVTAGEQELTQDWGGAHHYKPWELLAFLAASPGPETLKEKVLTALWPDVDELRGSKRLSMNMTRLRDTLNQQVPGLGDEFIRGDRDAVCRVEPSVISSDVHRFTHLCEAAKHLPAEQAIEALEEARQLYRGELLSGSPYRWLDERDSSGVCLRDSYREQHRQLIGRVARLYRSQGQPAKAVEAYRHLLRLEPTLEDAVRELYRCYLELGDRAAVIREHRHLMQSLQEFYGSPGDPGDDPSDYEAQPETTRVYNQVLAELDRATPLARSG